MRYYVIYFGVGPEGPVLRAVRRTLLVSQNGCPWMDIHFALRRANQEISGPRGQFTMKLLWKYTLVWRSHTRVYFHSNFIVKRPSISRPKWAPFWARWPSKLDLRPSSWTFLGAKVRDFGDLEAKIWPLARFASRTAFGGPKSEGFWTRFARNKSQN